MTLQYARLFQLRAALQMIAKTEMSKDELKEELRDRKSPEFHNLDSEEGAEDIIEGLSRANLVKEAGGTYQLTSEEDINNESSVLRYSGKEVLGAGDEKAQAERILANIMYQHPMLLPLSKFVYRNGPVKKYEAQREFDGEDFIGDKMNQFTIKMGLDLLSDANVIEECEAGYVQESWPIRSFAHIVYEEYSDLVGDSGSVRESDLFERIQNLYGISRSTFDNHIAKLHSAGIVSEGSYEQIILNEDVLEGARIHE
jgi:hypothetical protein